MTPADVRMTIASDPRLLEAIRGLIRGYVSGLQFPFERVEEIVLAVDEACSNAMRHSYCGCADGLIELELTSDSNNVAIELRDAGIPVPRECLERRPPAPPNLETLRPGGLGIQLIYEVFDEVEFHPGAERGNHVCMRLRRPDVALKQDRNATKG